MTMRKTLGGERLGAGKKMKVDLKTYDRSTHDLSYLWRSTMAPGTLVPFLVELGLPGDTFDIDLDCIVKTHPTIGPLFGSYKVQLDVLTADIRLYQGQLHNNKLKIGLKMSDIKLPQMTINAPTPVFTKPLDNQQINPSCIFSYLNIRGIGRIEGATTSYRSFNAVPYLAYWDIYKNYYANKQEEYGAVIHQEPEAVVTTITSVTVAPTTQSGASVTVPVAPSVTNGLGLLATTTIRLNYTGTVPKPEQVMINTIIGTFPATDIFEDWTQQSGYIQGGTVKIMTTLVNWRYVNDTDTREVTPQVARFPLDNIDTMRERILQQQSGTFLVNTQALTPYTWPFREPNGQYSKMFSLEGLALKTYQSDLFNNWISTEWIDGDNGINAITAIDTSEGNFTIDQLQLSKKVYDMLNRVALSGGSYDDWLDVNWTEERYAKPETPVYHGGLSKELVFQEVISNAAAEGQDATQPLGTLGGRGVMSKKHKGGKIIIKVKEPCYIMGIVSLTPRVDYSQGNKWDTNLKTMDDLHKPALDQIGFQDLITDQMAWWDTEINYESLDVTFKSAGKQPAWVNYMTNVNRTYGNFAIQDNEMFMTLNRRYEYNGVIEGIGDMTTYIDPIKFNYVFADTRRDAQNFWVQIGVDIEARRKMSAKIMPNL